MDGRQFGRVVEKANKHSAGVVRNQGNASFSGESRACESCGQTRSGIFGNWDLFPPGVKFDPTDEQLCQHLAAATGHGDPHPHIGSFIPLLDGEDGICQTHPMHLPGVKQDGSSRHFFHKPAKAYTTGSRKRRKIQSEVHEPGVETRWHKTGKTRSVSEDGKTLGWKKIMVLYQNSGAKKSKPEKTNWILHQYHLGNTEEETDGELVVCKVFYQKQPRQCTGGKANGAGSKDTSFTGDPGVSSGTAASPNVHTPPRPGLETGMDVETQQAAPVEPTSPPATSSPDTRQDVEHDLYINPSKGCFPGDRSGTRDSPETDNPRGGGAGDVENDVQRYFNESGMDWLEKNLLCHEKTIGEFDVCYSPSDGYRFEDPQLEHNYVELSSIPSLDVSLQFNDSEEAWEALQPTKATFSALDNGDSLSST